MITVLGLGFVGLTTALGFAKKGFKTFGIEINQDRLNHLKKLEIPFFEPHLKEVLTEVINKNFFLDIGLDEAVRQSDVVFICVGTPGKDDGSADLSHLLSAILDTLKIDDDKFKVLVVKSTVPPSTMRKQVKPFISQHFPNKSGQIGLASNPEFLREGYCWEDFIEPDRIVIGVEDEKSHKIMEKIYQPFNAPVRFVTYDTAEFIKYLSNTLLSTMISYSNEMAMIADKIGNIDIPAAFRILHEDKRWDGEPAGMSKYVYPGSGYGGYCLPKDTAAVYNISMSHGFEPMILRSNLEMNKLIKKHLVEKVATKFSHEKSVGILGLSFKSNSDDVRFTSSRDIVELLIENGFSDFHAYDPIANNAFKKEFPHLPIRYHDKIDSLVDAAEILLILTAWDEFKEKRELIFSKEVFDFRYIF
ncbi:MAG: UDP-glucose dehydrogenase family protein [Bacteroidales bacterium]